MFVGTAAWNIPKFLKAEFPEEGSHLQRYSSVLNAVEINSSFYREHLAKTYSRWAQEVPADFRFSVKLAKAFIHDCGLRPKVADVHASLENILHLEKKLGAILIQLPASMGFHVKDAERFYKMIRKKYEGPLVLEPRNLEWIVPDSQGLLRDYGISKALADPERCPGGSKKILSSGSITYFRLHGTPVIYKSSYSREFILDIKKKMDAYQNPWCIFDNTTFGFATQNALDLFKRKK